MLFSVLAFLVSRILNYTVLVYARSRCSSIFTGVLPVARLVCVAKSPQWQLHAAALSWIEAEGQCRLDGGHLSSIHSPDENENMLLYRRRFAQDVFGSTNSFTQFWIGGNDYNEEVRCLRSTTLSSL